MRFFILLLAAAGTASAAALRRTADADKTQYSLVLDAGSSGTRIYAYQYPSRPPALGTVPQVQSVLTKTKKGNMKQWSVKKKPGISSVAPQDIEAYLTELVNAAKEVVPAAVQRDTPIVLRATAGMRLLPDDQRSAIMNAVRAYLGDGSKHPFLFDRVKGALVISGEQEGVLAYLGLNYLTQSLKKTTDSYAVADLGGASTQLTFSPKEVPLARSFDIVLPNISKKDTVYVNSYLGFGENESKRRHNVNLATEAIARGVSEIADPCGWNGNKETFTYSDKSIVLKGAYDADKCSQYASKLLGLDTWCSQPPCALIGVYQPPIPESTPFYAVSNFAEVAEQLGCPMGLASTECLEANSRSQCASTAATDAKTKFSDLSDSDFNKLCFLARYAVQVLTQGYKLPLTRKLYWGQETEDRLEFSWTWGAVLEGLAQSAQ